MGTKDKWSNNKNLDCVIICGGLGTRMLPLTADSQKTMLPVNQKPLLHYVVEYWKERATRFVFITHYKSGEIEKFAAGLKVRATVIREEKADGIARALYLAKDTVGERFVCVLGDCLVAGDFHLPPGLDQGVGVTQSTDPMAIYQSYSIEETRGNISKVVEKPLTLVNDKLGMGVYFFTRRVFDFIAGHPLSQRTGRVELTDVIQTMINAGLTVKAVPFEGDYINVSYPQDLIKADRIAKNVHKKRAKAGKATKKAQPGYVSTISGHHIANEFHERVLLLRSVPYHLLTPAIAYVRKHFKIRELTLLCQPEALGEVAAMDGVDHVESIRANGLYKLNTGSPALIRHLRKKRYDAVVIPYNNPHKIGYRHLEFLALSLGTKVYGLIPGKNPVRLKPLDFLFGEGQVRSVPLERALFYAISLYLSIRPRKSLLDARTAR